MGSLLTKAYWDSVIYRINVLRTNPPDPVCRLNPIDTDYIDDRYIIGHRELDRIQAALKEVCSDMHYSDYHAWTGMPPDGEPINPQYIAQVYQDEIEAGILHGWCHCDVSPDPPDPPDPPPPEPPVPGPISLYISYWYHVTAMQSISIYPTNSGWGLTDFRTRNWYTERHIYAVYQHSAIFSSDIVMAHVGVSVDDEYAYIRANYSFPQAHASCSAGSYAHAYFPEQMSPEWATRVYPQWSGHPRYSGFLWTPWAP